MKATLCMLLVVCSLIQLDAQKLMGKVTAFGNIALNNVEVKTKSGAKTATDESGNFSLESKKKDVLFFEVAGFIPKKVKKKSDDFMKVNLLFEGSQSARKQALINGHISVDDLDEGISTVGFTNYKYYELSSIYEVLRLEHSGIRVDQSSGDAIIYFTNQGVHTIGLSTAALLVVNGAVVNDISMIMPTQVKGVNVLQGADAAHWGARGANGVIEIELLNGSE